MRRREMLAGGAALALASRAIGQGAKPIEGGKGPGRAQAALLGAAMRLETETGGRVGLALLDMADGRTYQHRGAERFPMCSSFKALLAAQVLARADRGLERLDRAIPVARADILSHSPFAETRAGGSATIAELARAAVTVSDNAAANLLLARGGGPAGLTRFLRAIGDPVTRLDRTELELNTALPDDPRDTSTPVAMVATLRSLLLGDVLAPPSRALLVEWMLACETGRTKLRAGLPPAWRVADKTGAGEHGSDNDVALLLPPGRAPLLVVSYLHGSAWEHEALAGEHAKLAKVIADEFG